MTAAPSRPARTEGASGQHDWCDRQLADLRRLLAERDAAAPGIPDEATMDLLETAWGIIANGGWDGMAPTPGWQEAAVRWRDRYHAVLQAFCEARTERAPDRAHGNAESAADGGTPLTDGSAAGEHLDHPGDARAEP